MRCSKASICFLKACLPKVVALYFVLGFFPMNDFSIFMYCAFSNVLVWLAKLPSVTSNSSLSLLKSTSSLTIRIDMMPSRIRWSNSLFMLSISPILHFSFHEIHYCTVYYVQNSKTQDPKPKTIAGKWSTDQSNYKLAIPQIFYSSYGIF